MADLTFQVQSLSSAGPDRVNVALVQVDANPSTTASPVAATPFFGANLNLNLSQADAAGYDVNQRYTLSLTPVAAPKPAA